MSLPIPVVGNYTATVYSVEPAMNNLDDIVITVSTDSSESAATLTDQLTHPLEQLLEEVVNNNEQISFVIETIERHGMSMTCNCIHRDHYIVCVNQKQLFIIMAGMSILFPIKMAAPSYQAHPVVMLLM